jgi:hypothetical protein
MAIADRDKGNLDTYTAGYMIPLTQNKSASPIPLTAAHLWLTAMPPPYSVVEGHYLVSTI